MVRLPAAAILVALAACHKDAPPRLFDEADVASLETQVLAKVAESRRECVRPELIELATHVADCHHNCTGFDDRRAPAGDAALDHRCAEKLAQLVHDAKEGCSPWQVGIGLSNDDVWVMHVAHMLSRRALALPNSYDAINDLLDATAAMHSLRRGHVPLLASIMPASAEDRLVAAIRQRLSAAPLDPSEIAALEARVDELLASDPPVLDMLVGENRYTALHMGLAPLHPFWVPPGGRNWILSGLSSATNHSPIDEHARMMQMALDSEALVQQICAGTMAACHRALVALPPRDLDDDLASIDRAVAKYQTMPSEGLRAQLKRDLTPNDTSAWFGTYVAKRANTIVSLASVRLQLEAMRTGRCPATFTPPQVGEPIRLRPTTDGVDVLTVSFWPKSVVIAHIRCDS